MVSIPTLLCLGCQSVGHNDRFLLQYKKDLRSFYDVENMSIEEKRKRRLCTDAESGKCEDVEAKIEQLKGEARDSLPKIYKSNLPFSLTDDYDLRTAKAPIRQGSPLNVIINKVHLMQTGSCCVGIGSGCAHWNVRIPAR